MFPHYSSIHHFTLNDPPSPKSKSRVIHLEDRDITPTNEYRDPFNKERVSLIQSILPRTLLYYTNPSILRTNSLTLHTRININPILYTHQHSIYKLRPWPRIKPLIYPSFVHIPSKPPSKSIPLDVPLIQPTCNGQDIKTKS